MKKIAGVLFVLAILSQPIEVSANSQALIPTYDVEGIPPEIQQCAEVIGFELSICPELLEAIAYQESRCTTTATNGTCKGLMQVNCSVHEDRFIEAGWSKSEWSNGYKNMYVAAQYLKELFDKYEDVGIVLGLYHGETNAIERAKRGQLSNYVTEILTKSEALERAHGK